MRCTKALQSRVAYVGSLRCLLGVTLAGMWADDEMCVGGRGALQSAIQRGHAGHRSQELVHVVLSVRLLRLRQQQLLLQQRRGGRVRRGAQAGRTKGGRVEAGPQALARQAGERRQQGSRAAWQGMGQSARRRQCMRGRHQGVRRMQAG